MGLDIEGKGGRKKSPGFDKWMSSDEKKISEEHERREGKRAEH